MVRTLAWKESNVQTFSVHKECGSNPIRACVEDTKVEPRLVPSMLGRNSLDRSVHEFQPCCRPAERRIPEPWQNRPQQGSGGRSHHRLRSCYWGGCISGCSEAKNNRRMCGTR